MAAFTKFKEASLARYLVMYELGDLHSYEAIETGIENSNYFVRLDQDGDLTEYVLTITEALSFDEVPFFNELMTQLARSGLPVPNPCTTLDGMSSTIFCGKPTWLFPRLTGSHCDTITASQSKSIGTMLAELHQTAGELRYHRDNPYHSEWVDRTLEQVRDRLSQPDQALLNEIAADYAETAEDRELPRGIIHGDLFKDNALFVDDTLTGVIDFYHACEDFLIMDIAITVNDWCRNAAGEFCLERQAALLDGYESVRPLALQEKNTLGRFQLFAALRFTLTRLLSGEADGPLKDPAELINLARQIKAIT